MIDTNNPPEFPNDTPESRISLRETIRKSGKPFDAERLDKADIKDRARIAEREAAKAAKAATEPARPRIHHAAPATAARTPATESAPPPPTKHLRLDIPLDLYAHVTTLSLACNRPRAEIILDGLYKVFDVQPLPPPIEPRRPT